MTKISAAARRRSWQYSGTNVTPTNNPRHLAQTGTCRPRRKKLRSARWWHCMTRATLHKSPRARSWKTLETRTRRPDQEALMTSIRQPDSSTSNRYKDLHFLNSFILWSRLMPRGLSKAGAGWRARVRQFRRSLPTPRSPPFAPSARWRRGNARRETRDPRCSWSPRRLLPTPRTR
jgi:hypothetical protein